MKSQAMLVVAMFALFVGYIELRLPVPIDAQGRAAVYERVSVVDTVANALRVAGGATVAGAMNAGSVTTAGTVAAGSVTTGTPIAPQYLGTGTRDGTKFLSDAGTWAGVSPPTDVAYTAVSPTSTNSTSFVNSDLAVTLTTPSATSDVLFSIRLQLFMVGSSGPTKQCEFRLRRSPANVTIGTWSTAPTGDQASGVLLEIPLLDSNPGAGTHTYTWQMRRSEGNQGACRIYNYEGSDTRSLGYFLGQVLQ